MQREVIFRDRQELQPADLNSVQEFAREQFDNLIADAVGDGLYYTGFQCEQTNTWELTVDPGRFYLNGKTHRRSTASVFDLFSVRPLSQKKVVAITGWGQTIETDIQARDFLIDVDSGFTEPQSVAMQRLRSAELDRIASSEAAQPQAPQYPPNNVLIALVTIGTGGIETIAMQEDNLLPQVARNLIEILEMIRWRTETGTTIDRLKTDLFTLARAQNNYTPLSEFADLREQLATVRQIAESAYARSTAFQLEFIEHFLDERSSDTAAAGYAALVDNGLRFPQETETQSGGLSLLVPNDPKVTVVDGLLAPKSQAKSAVDNSRGFLGSVSLLSYTTTTQTVTTRVPASSTVVWDQSDQFNAYHKSLPTGTAYTSGQLSAMSPTTVVRNGVTYSRISHSYNPATGAYYASYARKRTSSDSRTAYATVTSTLTAQGRAQTFIASSGGRLRDIHLFFETVAASGDVTVLITRTDGNNPNQADVLAQATIAAADLKTSGATIVPLPANSLEAGVRYSLNLLSQGNHKLRLSNQPRSITQGEHFAYVGDNKYIRPSGEADRDIAFKLNYQVYETTKVEVDLTPISMAGGMDGVVINGFVDEPEGTDLYFEVQVGGEWQSLDISEGGQRVAADFSSRPALVPFRLVMEGTLDRMPALHIGGTKTEVTAIRRSEDLKWVQEAVDLGVGNDTSSIKLTASLVGFEEDDMDCTLSLLVGGSPVAATSVTDVTLDNGEINRTAVFTLGSPTQSYKAVIEGAALEGGKRFFAERLSHYVGA